MEARIEQPSDESRTSYHNGRSADYRFEQSDRTKRQIADDDGSLLIFCERMNIGPLAREVCDNDIKSFVVHVIHSINWYHDAVAKQYRIKRNFFKATVALSGAMPVFAAVLPAVVPDTKSLSYGLIAGLLSGLLGLQRTVGTWLKHRKVEAVFNEAATQLKELLYDFEDKWAGVLPPVKDRSLERSHLNAHGRKFISELPRLTRQAREILAEERARYYEAAAPVLTLQQMRPSQLSGTAFSADTPVMGKFTFEAGSFTDEEKQLILRNHKLAFDCIDGCDCLNTEEKEKLVDAYKLAIEHYAITTPGVYARAVVGGVTIGINKDLLLSQPDEREIAQTLIHEMMHCAGYNHPPKTDKDVPGDNGRYYGSPPLQAERCIAGLQSDRVDSADIRLHECQGSLGNFDVKSA